MQVMCLCGIAICVAPVLLLKYNYVATHVFCSGGVPRSVVVLPFVFGGKQLTTSTACCMKPLEVVEAITLVSWTS